MSDTLQEAIEAAAKEITEGKAPEAEGKAPEAEVEVEEGSEEETTEEESTSEDDLTEEQVIESKNLYKALQGPQAGAIIAALAQQMGILPKANEAPLTKTEEKAAKRDLKTIVKDALGAEYSFLADKMGTIFETVLEQERAESESRFATIQQESVEQKVVAAYNKIATETKGASKNFESRMAELSKEVPIGDQNVETYMRRLYAIANSERKTSPQKVADQIRRNASDAPARIKGTAGPASKTIEIPTKKMNLNESVEWALTEMQKGKK